MTHVYPQTKLKRVRREHARQNLLPFTTCTKPDYSTNWHHEESAKKLDQVAAGNIRRLMVISRLFYNNKPLVG
jgi:hypothetical protein